MVHNYAQNMKNAQARRAARRPANAQYYSVGNPITITGFNYKNRGPVVGETVTLPPGALPRNMRSIGNMSLNGLLARFGNITSVPVPNRQYFIQVLGQAINRANESSLRRILNANPIVPPKVKAHMERRWLEHVIKANNHRKLLNALRIYPLNSRNRNAAENILVKKLTIPARKTIFNVRRASVPTTPNRVLNRKLEELKKTSISNINASLKAYNFGNARKNVLLTTLADLLYEYGTSNQINNALRSYNFNRAYKNALSELAKERRGAVPISM